ncbi:nuclear transport factor 2 family protein [Kistimonas asteriae]|uniref:nuclear transport factor 2 family protein n=1 Tax=Kistimonas asteriae TaxID=517724 RepID=UPI001BA87D1C|nr:nuclear transport factor 2 family protein [Kistimonas asteriae]
MTETELIEMARAYVALSNAHQLELVLSLFAEDATYYSAYVGSFEGKAAIASMMEAFFNRYQDIYWQVEAYQYTEEGTIIFDFIRHATDSETGEFVEVAGREVVIFSDKSLISRVEVYRPE